MKKVLLIGLLALTACWVSAKNDTPPQRCTSVNGGVGVRVSNISGRDITLTFENTLSNPMKVDVDVSTPGGYSSFSYKDSEGTAVQIPKATPYGPGTTTRTYTLQPNKGTPETPNYGNVIPKITSYRECSF